MKTIFRHSYLMLLFIPLLLSYCGNSGDPAQIQTVSIADIWVGNLTDYDKDGYYSYFNLYFDLNINEGSKEAFVLIAIRFHDPADTTTYYELFSTSNFTIEGSSDDDILFVDMELPSNDFPTSGYDFLFLVLDSSDPKIRLAEMSATDQELLSNVPLEHAESDAAVILNSMGVSDSVDLDGDGYRTSFNYNFILETLGASKDVYVVLAERNHDPDDLDSYYGYLESEDFTLDPDDGMVLIEMPVDNSDGYFPQNAYDFIFLVLDANERDSRLIETSATDNPKLRNVMIEPTDTDNHIFIYDAWFDDEVDVDQDGYNSEAWLVFDIDEVNGTGEDVFVEISQRETGTTNFIPLVKTTPFNVVSDAADARGIKVTDFSNFDHDAYDFKIDLKFAEYDIVEDWVDSSTDSDLSGFQLELPAQEQGLSVWNAWRSQVVDNDLDSFYSSVVITIDVDVSFGEADVYMMIGYKRSEESVYTYFDPTETFHISGDSREDDQSYIFWDFDQGTYDLRFDVYFAGGDLVQVIYDESDDFDINDIPLETEAQDPLP